MDLLHTFLGFKILERRLSSRVSSLEVLFYFFRVRFCRFFRFRLYL